MREPFTQISRLLRRGRAVRCGPRWVRISNRFRVHSYVDAWAEPC
jgi:hypothetical protein